MAQNYSGTKCPHCEKVGFELVEDAPYKSKFKFYYIRCMSCHTFLGVVEYMHIGTSLGSVLGKLDEIFTKVKRLG